MERIRALIADDEPLAREGIRLRLEQSTDIEIIGECGNGRQAIAAIQRDAPDLVFLDIQMPRLGGFEVIETIGAANMPYVIFVTAYDEYALRAFEVHALDYLLKPVDGARFQAALDHARAILSNAIPSGINQQLRNLLTDWRSKEQYLTRLSVKSGKTGGGILILNVGEIDWIEAAGSYIKIHSGVETYLLHATMNGLESRLDPGEFLRIHRSIIVNVRRIRELHPLFHGEYQLTLKDGRQLASGRSYREKLSRLLENKI